MSELSGFMRPCEDCNGTGARVDSDGYLKNCRTCNGTGIYQPILVELSPVVASEPGAAVRLEDYPASVQSKMIDLYWRGGNFTDVSMVDNGYTALSHKEAAMVADYQRRQVYGNMTPAEIAEYDASQDSMWEIREAKQNEDKRLADRAKAVDCSIETMRFIEMLEARIRDLENKLEASK